MFKFLALPVLALPRVVKRLVVICLDIILCSLTVWLAFYLRLGEWVSLGNGTMWRPMSAIFVAWAFALPIFMLGDLYRAIFRYSGLKATATVVKALAIYAVSRDPLSRARTLCRELLALFNPSCWVWLWWHHER